GAIFDVQQVLSSYLIAYLFWLGLPLGCTSLLLLNHLAFGTWGLTIRRPLEAGASTLLLMVPLFLPLAIGHGLIYPWAGAEHGEATAHRGEEAAGPEVDEHEGTTGTPEPGHAVAPDTAAEGGDGGH